MHRVSPLPCQFPHKGHPLSLQIFKAPEPRRFHPHRWQGSFPGAGSASPPPPSPPVILLLWCTCCRCRPSHIRNPNGSIRSSDQSHASVQKYMKKVILATWQPGNLATQQFCCLYAATPGRLAGNTGTEMITGPCTLEHRINGLVILGKRGWNGHTGTEDKLTGCTGTDCHTCTEATSFTASVVWVNVKLHMSLSDF